MPIKTLVRCGAALCLAVLATGCASGGHGTTSRLFNQCTWDRSSCMYEGSYEEGEESYAEDEAADLNRAEAGKVRRRGWFW